MSADLLPEEADWRVGGVAVVVVAVIFGAALGAALAVGVAYARGWVL